MPKARIFNIMQYRNHPETNETLLDLETIRKVCARKGVNNYAYILHDKDTYSQADEEKNPNHKQGEVKPPHWHIVIQMNYTTEPSVVAKWFGIAENFVDIPKGEGAWKFLDCVEYLTHESEKQQDLGKFRYDDLEVVSNFDWREMIDKRNETRLKFGKELSPRDRMRYEVLYEGKTLGQCIQENKFGYMNDINTLKKFRLEYISNQKPPENRINYYICGRGGIGKGLISRALARSLYPNIEEDDDIFFEVGAKGSAFEGYDGQPVIIWNDRRAIDLLQELNGRGNVFNVFDTHPSKQRQNIKYGSINLCNEVNIVNSYQPYIEFLEGLAGGYKGKEGEVYEAEDKGQSYRRFPFIIPVHEDDFDLLLNKGFIEDTKNFTEYIGYKGLVGNMQKIRNICGANEQLAKELESKTVQPVIEQHNKVMEKFQTETLDEDAIREMFKDYGSMKTVIEVEYKVEDSSAEVQEEIPSRVLEKLYPDEQ